MTADANTLQYGKWLDKAPGVAARLAMNVRVRGNRVVIYKSEAQLHNGRVVFSGSVDQHPEQVVRLRIKTDDMPLEGWEALVPAAAGYRLDGTLSAGLSLRQKSAPRDEPPTLMGSLRLANVNLIGPPGGNRNIQGLQGELEFRGNDVEIRRLPVAVGAVGPPSPGTPGQPRPAHAALQCSVRTAEPGRHNRRRGVPGGFLQQRHKRRIGRAHQGSSLGPGTSGLEQRAAQGHRLSQSSGANRPDRRQPEGRQVGG